MLVQVKEKKYDLWKLEKKNICINMILSLKMLEYTTEV